MRIMLPYQAVAMDYAVASGFHHHQRPGGLPGVMGLPGPAPGLNPGLNPAAFTHSWFVQTSPDICRQQQATNQSHLEPGHVSFFLIFLVFKLTVMSVAFGGLVIIWQQFNKINIKKIFFISYHRQYRCKY